MKVLSFYLNLQIKIPYLLSKSRNHGSLIICYDDETASEFYSLVKSVISDNEEWKEMNVFKKVDLRNSLNVLSVDKSLEMLDEINKRHYGTILLDTYVIGNMNVLILAGLLDCDILIYNQVDDEPDEMIPPLDIGSFPSLGETYHEQIINMSDNLSHSQSIYLEPEIIYYHDLYE